MTQAERKLDIFPHIFPLEYFERMKQLAGSNPGLAAALKRWMHIPVLWDLEQRIRMMKRWPGYQQVLTLSMPAIEFLGNEHETPGLARLANDGMHEIVQKHNDLFPCFVASLPMNNVAASLAEMDRAIGELGAKGVQIFTNVNGPRSTSVCGHFFGVDHVLFGAFDPEGGPLFIRETIKALDRG